MQTIDVLRSIRKYFPNEKIILSTWKGTDVEYLINDVHELILSDDPGNFFRKDGLPINLNRQIVSTMAGLCQVTTPYVIKIRSDTVITNDGFGRVFSRLRRTDSIFKKQLVICELFTRHPYLSTLLYDPSDLVVAGLTEDVLRLFSCPLVSSDYAGFVPEQHLALSLISELEISRLQWTFPNIYRSECFLHDNFLILSDESLGVRFQDRIYNGWQPTAVWKEVGASRFNKPTSKNLRRIRIIAYLISQHQIYSSKRFRFLLLRALKRIKKVFRKVD